jgi:DNA-binding transcriptional MocR family regulator
VVDETTADLDLRSVPAALPPFGAGRGRPTSGVVHLGSASKTFWGGLRVGWVRADRDLVTRLTVERAGDDLGSPLVEQLATAHLLDGVAALLPARRALLAARCAALRAAIGDQLPGWQAPAPDGGLVLWCRLPAPRSSALAVAARAHGVVVTPGPRFGVDGGLESRLRLPFARPEAELAGAVRLLGLAWRSETTDPVDLVHDVVL